MPAWSYTALTGFETCPRRHHLTRVTKAVKEPETEALRWGNYVHKAFEDRLKADKPLPATLAGYEGMCQKFQSAGELFVEREAAIDKSFKPTGWWDRTTWLRSKWDVAVKHGEKKLSIWDWKTGKRRPDSDQMKLFAAVGFLHEPTVMEITAAFIWLPDRKIDKEVYHRKDAKALWMEFLPRVQRLERAHEEDKWPAKPSGLCRKWCPCTTCEFCGG